MIYMIFLDCVRLWLVALSLCGPAVAGAADMPDKPIPDTQALTPDQAAIRENFALYKAAVLGRDGEAAVNAVDSATLAWYAAAVKQALSAGRKELHQLDLMLKLLVIRLRQQFSASELRQFDGAKAFVIGVQRGLIDAGSSQQLTLADIRVHQDEAEASTEQHPTRYTLRWRKEQDVWKFSFMALLDALNPYLEQQVKASGLSQEDYILALLKEADDRPVSRDLLTGPRN